VSRERRKNTCQSRAGEKIFWQTFYQLFWGLVFTKRSRRLIVRFLWYCRMGCMVLFLPIILCIL